MRLNPDCIRDVLLVVEDKALFGQVLKFPEDWPAESLAHFSLDELRYHINQCFLAELILPADKNLWDMSMSAYISDLSPSAHEFLANIREDTNWGKTKSIAKKVGSFSLSILQDIATGVVTGLIQKNI